MTIGVIARAICWDNCPVCGNENHCLECQDHNVLDGKYGEQAKSVIAALNAAGLVVVPKEPTEECIVAIGKIVSRLVIEPDRLIKYGIPVHIYKKIVKAMIEEAGK